jgi:hypothetical protein
MRSGAFIQKNGFGIILALGLILATTAAALTPAVSAEYPLRAPRAQVLSVAASPASGEGGLAVFSWSVFRGGPLAGTVAYVRGDDAPFELSGVWSVALDAEAGRVAVGEQLEVIDNTVDPPFERTTTLCRELGVGADELRRALYYDNVTGNAYITRPVVYELSSGEREALPVVGGDFLDWAGEDRLIIGQEQSGSKDPGQEGLALFGYNLDNEAVTPLAEAGEAVAKLGDKMSADVRRSPYLAASWHLVYKTSSTDTKPFLAAAPPGASGSFENAGNKFFWHEEGREAIYVGEGRALAVSGDGGWLITYRADAARPLTAVRLEWR